MSSRPKRPVSMDGSEDPEHRSESSSPETGAAVVPSPAKRPAPAFEGADHVSCRPKSDFAILKSVVTCDPSQYFLASQVSSDRRRFEDLRSPCQEAAPPEGSLSMLRALDDGSMEVPELCLVKQYHQQDIPHLLEEEINVLRQMEHGNIVRVVAVAALNADGDLLATVFKGMIPLTNQLTSLKACYPDLSPDAVRSVVHQVALALNHAHSRGFVHRNVRANSILVDFRGGAFFRGGACVVLLSEWQLAAPTGPQSAHKLNPDVGLLEYRAPEMLLNHVSYGPSVDVWALGMVTAGLLLGQMPPLHRMANEKEQLRALADLLGEDEIPREWFENYDEYAITENSGAFSGDTSGGAVSEGSAGGGAGAGGEGRAGGGGAGAGSRGSAGAHGGGGEYPLEELLPMDIDDVPTERSPGTLQQRLELTHPTAYDFLQKMLRGNASGRISALQSLVHEFFEDGLQVRECLMLGDG